MILHKLLKWSFITGVILPYVIGCGTPVPMPTQPINTLTPILLTATTHPPISTSTPVPEPNETFLVMTFNIECGAGIAAVQYSPNCMMLYERVQAEGGRIDRVIEFLRDVQPDILGVQEALRWADYETGTGQVVAEQLGLNYILGTSPSGDNHVALYTRFEILESETYGEPFTRAALRTKVKLPNESIINVFVVHLKPGVHKAELDALINILDPYTDEPTIVMGDFNDPHGSGLKHPSFELAARKSVDQIFTTQSVGIYADGLRYVIEADVPLIPLLSDHYPVMVEIAIQIVPVRFDWYIAR